MVTLTTLQTSFPSFTFDTAGGFQVKGKATIASQINPSNDIHQATYQIRNYPRLQTGKSGKILSRFHLWRTGIARLSMAHIFLCGGDEWFLKHRESIMEHFGWALTCSTVPLGMVRRGEGLLINIDRFFSNGSHRLSICIYSKKRPLPFGLC